MKNHALVILALSESVKDGLKVLCVIVVILVIGFIWNVVFGTPSRSTTSLDEDLSEVYKKVTTTIGNTKWMQDRRDRKEIERMEREVRKRELAKKLSEKE